MASRMDRYYKGAERSKKNQSLYEQISALGSYTNIEGVVDISNSNEINALIIVLKTHRVFSLIIHKKPNGTNNTKTCIIMYLKE